MITIILQISTGYQKLQNRTARIILKSDFYTPSATMFHELGWMSLESRIKYNKAILAYKARNNMTPDYITRLLTPCHRRILLICDQAKTVHCMFPFRILCYTAMHFLAPLNDYVEIRNSESLNAFKNLC